MRTMNLKLATLMAVLTAIFGLNSAQAGNTLTDNFTGASATLPWIAINGACLTAGNGSGSIPACVGLPYYIHNPNKATGTTDLPLVGLPTTGDPVGSGALRLTNGGTQGTNENGAIILANPYPSNEGIQVTFSTYTYGGNAYNNGIANSGADGIGFYLLNGGPPANGSTPPSYYTIWNTTTHPLGAFGGSLGYSCSISNNHHDGIPGGYLGLGIDEFGNYLNSNDNTATGIDKYLAIPFSNGGKNPGEIGLRGYGNINLAALQAINPGATQADVKAVCQNGGLYSYGGKAYNLPDYAAILNNPANGTKAYTNSLPGPISNQESNTTNTSATRTNATPITYRIVVTTNGLLSFWYNYNNKGFQNVIDQLNISTSNGLMPSSYYIGFGASTGGGTNVHEITCFEASPSTRATSAPIAPISISSNSYIYSLTSNPDPIAGHVQAFQTVSAPTTAASAPIGTASGPAVWDAGDSGHMPASTRQNVLTSTGPTPGGGAQVGSGPITPLTSLDSAAFNLTSSDISTESPCVPNTTVITSYTIDPNYTYTSGSTTCSYLAGRQSGWMLGGFSGNDHAQYLGPPGNANLLGLGGYVNFAQNNNKREQLVLFTSNDGFLYAIDSQSGDLVWGWMPRPFVSNLWNYSAFPAADYFDGGFTTTDAVDTTTSPAASDWASYVVGTAEGGAYHYSLKLSSNSAGSTNAPTPTAQAWGTAVNTTGTITAVSSPQEQAPVIVTFNGSQYALYVVNTTTGTGSSTVTTSTLYEQNVATGKPSSGTAISAALPFVANSSITYVLSTGTAWIGDNNGGVWSLNISGNAASDAGNATQVATTSPKAPINYVGYTEINGLPYIWAATLNEITAFSLSGGTSQIIWASSGGATPSGYLPNTSGSLQASTSVAALQSGGQISAAPALVNGVLVVPVYVPPSGNSCGLLGEGYYDFFDLLSGGLPKIQIIYKNNVVTTGMVDLGSGSPFTPSVSVTPTGTVIYPGSSTPPNPQSPNPISPIQFGGNVMNKPIAWRQY